MIEDENSEVAQREKIVTETAKMAWTDLQPWFASGLAIYVAAELDLIEVAWQMSQDNKTVIAPWVENCQVGRVTDTQAEQWVNADAKLWAAVIKPWVLVQPIS